MMSEENLTNLEKKKQKLEIELANIQSDLDKSIDDVREGVSFNIDPKNLIRKYPLPMVGASLLLGFFLGKDRKKSERISSNTHSGNKLIDSGISREIKSVIAKKGLSLLLDYLDDKLSELKENESD